MLYASSSYIISINIVVFVTSTLFTINSSFTLTSIKINLNSYNLQTTVFQLIILIIIHIIFNEQKSNHLT